MTKFVAIASSIASILSFLLALLLLPSPFQIWGFAIAALFVIVGVVAAAYEIGRRRNKPPKSPIRIFSNRDEMLEEWPYREMILTGEGELLVLGGTLRSFVTEAHLDWIRQALQSDSRTIRLLVMNPASPGSYLRAQEEGRVRRIYNDLNTTLAALLRFERTLSASERVRIELRKYSALPAGSFFLKTDRAAYTHYLHNRSSTSSLWYLLARAADTEPGFQKLTSHFDSIWADAVPVSEPDNYVVIFVGPPGSGKTTVARRLNGALRHSKLLSSSDLRRELSLTDIFSERDRSVLQRAINAQLFYELSRGNRRLIVDSNLYPRSLRDRIVNQLTQMYVDVYIFRLTASQKDLLDRIEEKRLHDELYAQLNLSSAAILTKAIDAMGDAHIAPVHGVKAEFAYDTSENELRLETQDDVAAQYSEAMIKLLQSEAPIRLIH